MKKKRILMISNGRGEDTIASNILKEIIKRNPDIDICVLPVVGRGTSYQGLDVELLGPRQKLPSGGFLRNSFKNLKNDIKAGVIGLTVSQIKTIRKIKSSIDLVIVVGDVYILLLAGLFTESRIVFLPTAKSEYIDGHYFFEKKVMKKYAEITLPRDEKTASVLKKSGVNAVFVGNAMMDCFEIKGPDFNLKKKCRTIGILPGSREEAYDNLLQILEIVEFLENINDKRFNYLTAMASNLSTDRLVDVIKDTAWNYEIKSEKSFEDNGIAMVLESPSGKSRIKIVYHHFGDILDQADIFIGLAGTANEQAVGLGKPLVIFPGTGSQFTRKFALAQKSLLGDSVEFVERKPELIAGTIIEIINDEEKYRQMARTGRKRMGPPGAIKRIVDKVEEEIK